MDHDLKRKRRVAESAIEKTGLDLSGLTVLTEIGTADFALTPLLPYLAGADRVIGWVRDSRWGTSNEVVARFADVCVGFGVEIDRFTIRQNLRPREDIAVANIITNSGMLRPLDATTLAAVDVTRSVISLMYDAWEVREADIDLEACRKLGIRVCGANESVPEFPIFSYVGPLVAKMLMEAGCEVMGNRIIIWSDDDFGVTAKDYLQRCGADYVLLTHNAMEAVHHAPSADVILFADYHGTDPLLGTAGTPAGHIFDLQHFRAVAPCIKIVHLYGALDASAARKAGYTPYPDRNGAPQSMTFTLAHVGAAPLIRLMAAGLRAAQEVVHKEPLRFAQPVLNMKGAIL